MLHTTARLARSADACCEDVEKMRSVLGEDTPIALSVVLAHTSLESALWALRCVLPEEEAERDRIARLFACDCAARVLAIFERARPDDDRLRRAIEMARRFAIGEATRAELAAVEDAAWDALIAAGPAIGGAARDAAWDAIGAAARDVAGDVGNAARSTERAEQARIFLEYLGAAAPVT